MNENQNTQQKSSKIEWESVWEVTKKWAVMSGFEKDLENYEKLSESIQSGDVRSE
jgi:hypothetical protein